LIPVYQNTRRRILEGGNLQLVNCLATP
jgi:hypothetical protein